MANRLKSTTSGNSTISYAYDGDGKRLQETAGSAVTKLLWDVNYDLPQLALERNGSNALIRRYVYGRDLLSLQAPSSSFYYHGDGLGSIVNMTNSTGAKQWTYVWEPFGTKRSETKNNNKAPTNPIQFAGEYLDAATSLYHLRARQYDPAVGRFQRTDPLPQPIGEPYAASYVYADNRPTVLVDPSGLDAEKVNCDAWPAKLPFIGDDWCGGMQLLSPRMQGIIGATVTAGPYALPVAGAGTPLAGRALIRLSGTRYGAKLFGHPAYNRNGVKGVLNDGQVRIGVGRHQGPVFRIGIRGIHFDWPR